MNDAKTTPKPTTAGECPDCGKVILPGYSHSADECPQKVNDALEDFNYVGSRFHY